MTNSIRGTVTHEIDGERVELKIATNEWCELEEEMNKPTGEILVDFFTMARTGTVNMRFVRTLFRAALSHAKPGVTEAEAGVIMNDLGVVEATALLGRVILAAMPKSDDTEAPGKPQAGKPALPKR